MSVKAFFVGLILTVVGASSMAYNSFAAWSPPTLIQMVFDSMGSFWSLMLTIVGVLVMLFGGAHSKKYVIKQ